MLATASPQAAEKSSAFEADKEDGAEGGTGSEAGAEGDAERGCESADKVPVDASADIKAEAVTGDGSKTVADV
ncbi:hypothetical protein YDYSY3_05830 [Paenibacillus chitinolyticus]|uniref:hypothetical protein n=1 Tax=Paenibacillus chitinolyticus TaxID=79263 RepID=UPI0026E4E27D|nr:hypothetical protein [Paenibacillus chitinolyticus]GKS09583.1 hypothetical protein YDYSY3_05830 [Paenibacillus chitinolyticus]